jgi:hypothetical protein
MVWLEVCDGGARLVGIASREHVHYTSRVATQLHPVPDSGNPYLCIDDVTGTWRRPKRQSANR